MKHILAATVIGAMLSGCGPHAIQTTSGTEYMSNNQNLSASDGTAEGTVFDQMLKEAAAVEPTLKFPAHIGLARLENGYLTEVPAEEMEVWTTLAEKYPQLGRFSLLDPLAADFTAQTIGLTNRYGISATVKKVRLGAARQHMDAVLVYDVSVKAGTENTALAFMDLTIIGGAILPTRSTKIYGVAKALLLGVHNGYPYGTANAQTKFEKLSPSWGSDAYREKAADQAAAKVVADLIPHVEDMFIELQPALAQVNPAQVSETAE